MVNWISLIMESLAKNAIGLQVIFTMLIFIATAIYVIINTLIHREMVKQRKKDEIPNVSFVFEQVSQDHTLFFLIIKNISSVEVFNLKFLKYPKLKLWTVKGTTADVGFIKNGIEYMGVGQIYKEHFLELFEKENRNIILDFEIEYYNKEGKKYHKEFSLNTAMFNTIGHIVHPTVVDELKKLRELLEKYYCRK